MSISNGCIRFIDRYRFSTSSLDELVNNLDEDDFKILKKEFPDKWMYLNKKLAYTYEHFNSNKCCQNSVDNVKKEDFFSNLKTKCPSVEEIERTK